MEEEHVSRNKYPRRGLEGKNVEGGHVSRNKRKKWTNYYSPLSPTFVPPCSPIPSLFLFDCYVAPLQAPTLSFINFLLLIVSTTIFTTIEIILMRTNIVLTIVARTQKTQTCGASQHPQPITCDTYWSSACVYWKIQM